MNGTCLECRGLSDPGSIILVLVIVLKMYFNKFRKISHCSNGQTGLDGLRKRTSSPYLAETP